MSAIDEYIRLAGLWGEALEAGESETANALVDRIDQLYQNIQHANLSPELFRRAEASTDAARFFVASHVKATNIERAIKLYEQLENSPMPFLSLSAKHLLNGVEPRRQKLRQLGTGVQLPAGGWMGQLSFHASDSCMARIRADRSTCCRGMPRTP